MFFTEAPARAIVSFSNHRLREDTEKYDSLVIRGALIAYWSKRASRVIAATGLAWRTAPRS